MIDINIYDLNKYYGSNHVIKGVTFEVNNGERIGLLGNNGTGKTTLFKMIAGEEPCDSGSISIAPGKKVGMLAQIPAFGINDTSEDVMRSSFREAIEISIEMEKIAGDGTPAVFNRYCRLMEEFGRLGGYDIEYKLDKVCGGMEIDANMRNNLFEQLSGGEKARVNLARILLRDCDILLLDEPTNHLDLSSLEWLENFLREFPGTIIVISHDRVFLDCVITRIIEIDDGKANFYSGNFTWYKEEKLRRYTSQSEQYERQQKEIKRIEDRAKWFVVQNRFTTKHHAILSRIDHMDKIDKPASARKLTGGFDSGSYASKEIVSIDYANKSYGAKTIVDNLSAKIFRNDRIALVGANGCGKTTLLKMITGDDGCDSGEIKVGASAKLAYMPQIISFDNGGATVMDMLRYAIDASEAITRSILAGFNFRGADVIKKVSSLSGGEKSRLKLCLMMQNNVNFLLLDEPTNHLDIASREWMENVLSDFEGTMLFVSHDRYFLNKYTEKVWHMDNGAIAAYDCGFEEYSRMAGARSIRSARRNTRKTQGDGTHGDGSLVLKHKRTVPMCSETMIHEAEAELKKVIAAIEAELSKSEYSKMDELYAEKVRLETRIDTLYNEWLKNN